MKKTLSILLTSTALVSAEKATAPKIQGQAPQLKISGFTIVNAAAGSQNVKDNGKKGSNPHVAIGASDLTFTVSGKTTSGIGYKYRVNFEAIPGVSSAITKNYIELNGNFGTFQVGDLKGIEDTMITRGADMVGGALGIDGTLNTVYNFSSGVIKGYKPLIESNKSTKFVYYTPNVYGFQLGFAYTPNTSHWGKGVKDNSKNVKNTGLGNALYATKDNRPFGTRHLAVGLRYKRAFGDWNVNLAGAYLTEKTKFTKSGTALGKVHDGRAYVFSGVLGYKGLQVAAGYHNNLKSRMTKDHQALKAKNIYTVGTEKGNAGYAWDVGASYSFGAYKLAAAYHRTDRKLAEKEKANSNIVTVTADMKLFEGWKIFGEMDFINTKTDGTKYETAASSKNFRDKPVGDNRGTLFILGTKISF